MIETVHLFPKLNLLLIELLSDINENDWNTKTQFPNWKIKDIAAHLLDTSIRKLSSERDGYESIEHPIINSYEDLIKYITNLADRWSFAFTNVSPKILLEMINKYQNELSEYLLTLDLSGFSHFPVSWAGEEKSYNWFDIAREYTERWHHQMQIREVLGKEEKLYTKELYFPVLDTFMQALPFHYKKMNLKNNYVLEVDVTGNSGGKWFVEWNNNEPELKYFTDKTPNTVIQVDEKIVWKILTKWNDKSLSTNVKIIGDQIIGNHFIDMTCLMIS